jgi:hypothetical protein
MKEELPPPVDLMEHRKKRLLEALCYHKSMIVRINSELGQLALGRLPIKERLHLTSTVEPTPIRGRS